MKEPSLFGAVAVFIIAPIMAYLLLKFTEWIDKRDEKHEIE